MPPNLSTYLYLKWKRKTEKENVEIHVLLIIDVAVYALLTS